LILTFILTVAISNIIGAITMLILDKKKDIAILNTLGLSNEQIRKVYLIQGLLISLIGVIIGLLLGSIFVFLQEKYGIIKISGSEDFLIQAYPIKLIYRDYFLVFLTVMGISFIASWFSSKQSNILASEIKENINNV
jgi:lipoprotein-releasing system permease protein